MLKRIVSITIAACLVFTNFFGFFGELDFSIKGVEPAYAETSADGFDYTIINGDEIIITKYRGSQTDVKIPYTIDDKLVVEIGTRAFSGCMGIKSIEMDENIVKIGNYAFSGCINLESITLPDYIESIGNYAFHGCRALKSIKIPDYTTEINLGTFYGCKALKEVTNLNSVTYIGKNAFNGCTSLISMTMPSSLEKIDAEAFNGCSALESVVFKGKSTAIDSTAFNSSGLKCIYAQSGSTAQSFANGQGIAFKNTTDPNGFTIDIKQIDGTIKIMGYSGSNTALTIPSQIYGKNVTGIGYDAFYKKSSLTSVVIPEGVVEIGSWAFKNCTSLKSVTIPSTVKSIDFYAFEGCTSLTSASIPEGVELIHTNLFAGCTSLKSVTIPSSIKVIEEEAFKNCKSLTSIEIPSGVNKIGASAFYGCASLSSVVIPEGVEEIDEYTFKKCTNLKSVVIPNSVKSIKGEAFDGCSSLKSIKIPESVNDIEADVFDSTLEYIYGAGGSYAEEYAGLMGIKFKAISSITKSSITVASISNRIYTGKEVTPSVTVKDGSTKLVKDVDYSVSYSNNIKIGTATVTITGINGYTGSRKATFKVVPRKVSDLSQTDRTTGTIEMSWKSQEGGVKYQLYRATSKTGKYSRVISTKYTTYRDSGRSSGKIYYYKVRAYKVVDSKYYYGNYSDVFTACTKCKTPSITVTSPKKGAAKITWNKISGASGYQVKRSTSKYGSYTTAKTVTSGSTISYTDTGRTSKKTYYYKVRAYKTVNGKKVYGSYSTIKSIKIK